MAYDPTIPALNNYIGDDIPKIMANFAELAGSRIVEMGSNANGEYVRWENGLQVCFGFAVAFVGDGSTDAKVGTYTLPAPFVSPAALWAGNAAANWRIFQRTDANEVETAFAWQAERVGGSWGSGIAYPIHFIAIGRWK